MKNRAARRHHRERLRKRWHAIISRWYISPENIERVVERRISTRKPCSCAGCANWRAMMGPTRPERLADLSLREQLSDLVA